MKVKDPTLYRVFTLLIVPARAGTEGFDLGLERVNAAINYFAQRAGLPQPEAVISPHHLAWHQVPLWNTKWVKHNARGINLQAFAQTRHSDGVLLLGLEQDGTKSGHTWHAQAEEWWEQIYGQEKNWGEIFAFPEDESAGSRLRVTGQAWVSTNEWETAPDNGWESYARQHYGSGEFYLFAWGVLGYRQPPKNKSLPIFELHVEARSSEQRDQLLYGALPLLLIDLLKVSQFIWFRHQKYTYSSLSHLEQQLLAWIENSEGQRLTPTLHTIEEIVRHSAILLNEYSNKLAEIADDVHTVATDCAAVRETLASIDFGLPATPANSFMAAKIKRVQDQLASDLDYFKITEKKGERVLSTLQTLVEIERARGENRLVVIGIILATLIGFSQLLPDKYTGLIPDRYGNLVRLALSLLLSLLAVGLYYLWHSRWRAGKDSGARHNSK